MKQRQPFISNIPIKRIAIVYAVLLFISITNTIANEAYVGAFSSSIEDENTTDKRSEQLIDVTGQVIDEEGVPLIGVEVLIKGTSIGTTTDVDGYYTLDIEDADVVLVFTYLGYASQEVLVNSRNVVNVTLSESTALLDEVVVVAYGSQKKVNLTGSIATIKSEGIVKNSTQSISSALSGRLAGVTTIQNSGEPGSSSSSINIRGLSSLGSNAPLILVDGIPRAINNVNANDIESISVLKDAAASAIYGMRAANGVVLITTKRGKGANKFNVNMYTSLQEPTRIPDFLNSFDYATLLNEANANDGVGAAYTDDDLQKFSDGSSPDTHPDTDWLGETLGATSPMHSVSISSSGSSENESINYFASVGYLYQDALYDNNEFDRFNYRTNLDIKINQNISLSTDFSGNIETRTRPGISASSLFSGLMRTPPTEVNQYSNGEYSIFSRQPAIDVGYSNRQNLDIQSKIALRIDFPFLEGLNLITQVAYDRSTFRNKSFSVPATYSTFNSADNTFEISTPSSRGESPSLSDVQSQGSRLVTESILSYGKSVDRHDFGAKLIYSRTVTENNSLAGSISNILGNSVDYFISGDAETRGLSNNQSETGILGYAGRFTYALDSKYLFEFNGRYDGSYKFSKDSRFGFFPSYSMAWRASEEDFLKNSNSISNLKLRASYGELGNDSGIGAFRYLEFFGFGGAFIDNSSVAQTIASSGLPDPATTWEKAKSYNFGLELGLWKNSLTVELDVFSKTTSDILTTRSLQVPGTFGASLPFENIGIIDNKGFEIILNHRGKVKNASYFVNFNIGHAKNKIVDIAEVEGVDPLRKLTGRSIGTRFGFVADGLFLTQQEIDDLNGNSPDGTYQTQNPQPGDIRYVDVNGDGKVDNDDRTVIGNGNVPEITFGMNLGFSYKNFDFSALFQGAANFDMYLSQEAAWAFFNGGKVFDTHLDRAQIGADGNVSNVDASYPRLSLANNAVNERTSSYWVVPGDYLRFKNIEIAYSLSENITNRIGVDNFRIYLSGRNLFTWSEIKHLDPENPQQRGWFYPQQKVYTFGVNVQF